MTTKCIYRQRHKQHCNSAHANVSGYLIKYSTANEIGTRLDFILIYKAMLSVRFKLHTICPCVLFRHWHSGIRISATVPHGVHPIQGHFIFIGNILEFMCLLYLEGLTEIRANIRNYNHSCMLAVIDYTCPDFNLNTGECFSNYIPSFCTVVATNL